MWGTIEAAGPWAVKYNEAIAHLDNRMSVLFGRTAVQKPKIFSFTSSSKGNKLNI